MVGTPNLGCKEGMLDASRKISFLSPAHQITSILPNNYEPCHRQILQTPNFHRSHLEGVTVAVRGPSLSPGASRAAALGFLIPSSVALAAIVRPFAI